MSQCQVIKCKCGKVFAMCRVPECYQDSDWMKDVRKYVKKGCIIEVGESKDYNFEKCICENKSEPTLF